ncbi:MAG: NPCBM/NEW2 domain-containing protein [Planctomycetaceae bacterium]|jgi:hypothetical protein|nr:NPCBM/NEW2 domain-containing protein [Planctomycetaceae bacterium]
MKRIFTIIFFALFFSEYILPAFGVEFPFEIIDVDGEGHVGQITALDSTSIQLDTGSDILTFASRRIDVLQNLAPNPFLTPAKSQHSSVSSLQNSLQANRPQRTIIINGQMMIVNEFGVPMRIPQSQRKTNRNLLPPSLLKKLNAAKNDKNTKSKQENKKLPQFPKSVIVIDLLDGGRLVATSFTAKDQKITCNLLDPNYSEPETKNNKQTNTNNKTKTRNETKTENEPPNITTTNNASTNNNVTNNKNAVDITIPLDQIYAVRFAVKSFTDIAEPPVEWINYTNESGITGDRLIINKTGTFDVYSGIVAEVTKESVIFIIDDEKLPIQRNKIFGMILHSPNRKQIQRQSTYGGQITFWTGTQLILDSFAMKKITASPQQTENTNNNRNNNVNENHNSNNDNDVVADVDENNQQPISKIFWKALAGFSGEAALSDVDNIVFSRGNSLYFNDLSPVVRERFFPFEWSRGGANSNGGVTATDNSSPTEKLKSFQINRLGIGKNTIAKIDPSLEQITPLVAINAKKRENQPIPAIDGVILNGVAYRRGIMLPPKTTLEYTLDDKEKVYSAIRGFAGIDDRLKPNGRAKLNIKIDDNLICSLEIKGTDPVKLLRYELPDSHKKITITVDFDDNITEFIPIGIGDLKLIK